MCHHKGVPKQVVSLAVALAMLLPAGGPAAAESAGTVWSGTPVAAEESGIMLAAGEGFGIQLTADTGGYTDPSPYVTDVAAPTTYQEVYDRMTAFRETYPEGLAWTNFKPYGSSGPLGSAYTWHGGSIKGANGGVGCAAFVFILSDAAFGSLPARTLDSGSFTFDDVRVGDILRVNNNSHFVIVLQKSAAGVTVAEANYNSSVHWGRAMSEAEVMSADFLVTRYPENFVPSDSEDADEVVGSGTESSLNWALTKAGVLTISGSGAMPDYSPNDNVLPGWNQHTDAISTIIIEKGISSIGDYAFYQTKALSVYIPDSVVSIGQSAFRQASASDAGGPLAITIPGSVKTIGDDAFRYCENITSVTIADGVTSIGERAFQGCTSLTHIDFPASVTSVGAGAFTSCSKMTRVRFMPGNQEVVLGDDLFTQCYALMDVTLPQTLKCISARMFESCISLFHIYIPASVSEIGESPFMKCSGLHYDGIYFGGSESDWQSMGGNSVLTTLQPNIPPVYYNITFDDPFAKDPNDPGDLLPGDSETPGTPGTPGGDGSGDTGNEGDEGGENPGGGEETPPAVPDNPSVTPGHTHAWSAVWSYDEAAHWHECGAADCTVTDSSVKDGYAAHTYGVWVTDVAASAYQDGSRHRDCTVCGYRQTENIPATGGPSYDYGSDNDDADTPDDTGSGSSSSPSSSTPSTTPPASTPSADVTTETTRNPDGSVVVTTTRTDGTVAVVTTSASGKVETEVTLPAAVVQSARQRGEAVVLPIAEVPVTRDVDEAPVITVHTGQGGAVKAAIPAAAPTAGTVAVLVKADGTAEILKTSVATDNSVVADLPDGAAVKIVDNGKRFADVPGGLWSEDAVAFVSARELFLGTTESTFSPDATMTRAMLMTVLARFDGGAGDTIGYAEGIEWAVAQGVSDGTNPDGNITREQLVVMLWRYLGSPAVSGALSSYTDTEQISSFAQDAMRWAVANGILNGFEDGRLAPQGQATRAQVAQVLKNLIENITLNP